MRKYFLKLYSETGKKPFTFLNACLMLLIPFVVFIVLASKTPSSESFMIVLAPTIGVWIACIVINVVLTFSKFKDGGTVAKVTILSLFASLAFFCKLILFPFIKFLFRGSTAMTAMQSGDTQQAASTMNRSQGVKTSAFNWFNYDGVEIQDIPGDEPASEEYIYNNNAWDPTLQRSYTSDEDNNARQMGYQNASHAVNSGVDVSKLQ